MKQKDTLDRVRVPDNIIDRERGLEYRMQRLERLMLTQEVAGTLYVPIESPIAPPFSGARVYSSTNQSIANDTSVTIPFDSESYDTDSYHDNSTNNDRLTIPQDGYYRVGCNVGWLGNATGYRDARIRINGTITIVISRVAPVSGGASTDHQALADYFLSAGDYIIAEVRQTSGGALTLLGIAPGLTSFFIHRIG